MFPLDVPVGRCWKDLPCWEHASWILFKSKPLVMLTLLTILPLFTSPCRPWLAAHFSAYQKSNITINPMIYAWSDKFKMLNSFYLFLFEKRFSQKLWSGNLVRPCSERGLLQKAVHCWRCISNLLLVIDVYGKTFFMYEKNYLRSQRLRGVERSTRNQILQAS